MGKRKTDKERVKSGQWETHNPFFYVSRGFLRCRFRGIGFEFGIFNVSKSIMKRKKKRGRNILYRAPIYMGMQHRK